MNGGAPGVLVERRGAIAIVTINRPERRNAVDMAQCWAIYEAVREVAASDARIAILRGAGKDFCVGADLDAKLDGSLPTLEALEPVYQSAVLLHSMRQVTIAAIDGGCAGAGLGLACACDFRFASDAAKFATAFLDVRVSGDMGLAWTLTRIVGAARARELLLFPAKFGAEQALEMGVVSRLFPRASLHEEVLELARLLEGRDPFALRMHKANLVSAEKLDFASFVDIETARHLHTTARDDFRDGLPAPERKR